MTYYTVWYIKDGQRIVWATGLTKEQAEAAVKALIEEFRLNAGIEEE